MTAVYGIVGDPIAQVRSPAVFNARFRAAGIDAVMVPLHVPATDLESALEGLRAVANLAGLVITVPHKRVAARKLRAASRRVQVVGAANVLRHRDDGWEADLLDGEGFALGLERTGFTFAGKRCAVVGAGGAGAAIALALAERRVADLVVTDVNADSANVVVGMLQELNLCSVSVGRPGPATDLAINATPLGMALGDPLPIDLDALRPGVLVAEAIMKPPLTPLLMAATRLGFRTHEGRHMLDGQFPAMWRFFSLPGDASSEI